MSSTDGFIDGRVISFWSDVWLGEGSLKSRFPNLYEAAVEKDSVIADFWIGNPTSGHWDVQMRQNLRGADADLIVDLFVARAPVHVLDRGIRGPREMEA
ncbi:hypothetical protein QJS10_CPA01g01726 [Acorus calamus]|uniref:Uncharacterized protein n=1 Tax=Acorus calamus TaxID=4465 RepID=A0AAV9FN49_ACOCL|nr:hypothetical protein QJS10_CPA01g01726 [Acorus calamus]